VTKENLAQLISTYHQILVNEGVQPKIVDVTQVLPREDVLAHCLWVLQEKITPLLSQIGGFQEALRLIGCIQGTVMAYGLSTIAETRQHANDAKMTTWDRIMG